MQNDINIKNRRASFDYEFLEEYTAGIMLTGTEIKSIRAGKAGWWIPTVTSTTANCGLRACTLPSTN